jgi:hypothetical protein
MKNLIKIVTAVYEKIAIFCFEPYSEGPKLWSWNAQIQGAQTQDG